MFPRQAACAMRQVPLRSAIVVRTVLRPGTIHAVRLMSPCVAMQMRNYADSIVKVPQMAESISEGTLAEWSKKVGDYVELDEELASIETDKSNVAVNAPDSGTIKELLVNEGDTVTVGQDLARIEPGGSPASGEKKGQHSESKAAEQPQTESVEESKPAKEERPPSKPSQTAPEPQSQEKRQPPAEQQSRSSGKELSSSSPTIGTREEHRVKMNRMRLRIAERLKLSQNTTASLTTFQEVDMSALMELRKRYRDEVLKDTGVKLGFMSAFARATVLAIRDIPAVNAFIEGPNGGDTIVYHDYVDISVAVATPKGLVTPVVRNVESMGLVAIEKAIAELGKKARDNKLPLEDLAGGTFTISNGGVFGSLMGTPIINPPQSAILGLHAIKDRPVAVNGKVEIRPMMNLALSYDHRIIDGREAVTFLVKIKELIEDPAKMLLYD